MTAAKKLHVGPSDGVDASIVDGVVFIKNVIHWNEADDNSVRLNRSEAVLLYEWLKDALHSQALWKANE